jgi:signal transduction histidine kinase/DNA-binding response OmpR family regulator
MSQEIKRLMQMVESLQRENAMLRDRTGNESNSLLIAEEALRQSENQLQMALDAAGLSVWEWDIAAKVVYTSGKFYRLFGQDAAGNTPQRSWYTEQLWSKVHTDDTGALQDALVRVLKQQDTHLEVEVRLSNQSQDIWIECNGAVTQRDMMGHGERMMGTCRNVTHRRNALLQVGAMRAQALAASADQDEFCAHPVPDSDGLAVHNTATEPVHFSLRQWLWDTIEPQRLAAHNKGLELDLQADDALPEQVVGDPVRMGQILTHLVHNAIQFTHQGTVQIALQSAGNTEQGLELLLEVIDTGIGIAQDQQEDLFDTVSLLDDSSAEVHGDTGLGLPGCAKLVEALGGNLQVASALGEGSRFMVLLPVGLAQHDAPAAELGFEHASHQHTAPVLGRSDGTRYAGKVALVVDDDGENLLWTTKLLERLGLEIETAQDGEKAVEAIWNRRFDVILMKAHMPQMTGWETAQHIRDWELQAQKSRTPIVALSVQVSAVDWDQAIAHGMDGCLLMPLTREALQAALQSTLLSEPAAQHLPEPLPEPLHEHVPKHIPEPVHEPEYGPRSQQSAVTEAMPLSTDIGPPLAVDRERLLKRLGGDEAALLQMASAFRRDLRERLSASFKALKMSDWQELQTQSHALKDSLLGITAEATAQYARDLEIAAQDQDARGAQYSFDQLSEHAKPVYEAVSAW